MRNDVVIRVISELYGFLELISIQIKKGISFNNHLSIRRNS